MLIYRNYWNWDILSCTEPANEKSPKTHKELVKIFWYDELSVDFVQMKSAFLQG